MRGIRMQSPCLQRRRAHGWRSSCSAACCCWRLRRLSLQRCTWLSKFTGRFPSESLLRHRSTLDRAIPNRMASDRPQPDRINRSWAWLYKELDALEYRDTWVVEWKWLKPSSGFRNVPSRFYEKTGKDIRCIWLEHGAMFVRCDRGTDPQAQDTQAAVAGMAAGDDSANSGNRTGTNRRFPPRRAGYVQGKRREAGTGG